MQAACLRKLRLLFEDSPRSHNLALIGQTPLLQALSLSVNEEIRSRVTYSTLLPRLAPEVLSKFVLNQLDPVGLGQHVHRGRVGTRRTILGRNLATSTQPLPSEPRRSRSRSNSHRGSQTGQRRAHPTPLEKRLCQPHPVSVGPPKRSGGRGWCLWLLCFCAEN